MAYLSLFLAFISSLPCIYIDWKAKSPMFLFWLLNIPFVYIPFYFFIENRTFYESTFIEAANFIVLCNILYFGLFILFSKTNKKYTLDLQPTKTKDFTILAVSGVIPLILLFNGVDVQAFLESNLTSKRDLGSWYLVLLGLSAFLFSQFIYVYKNKKKILGVIIFLIFLLILFYFRSRSIIGLFFLPLFFYILFFNKEKRYILFLMVPLIFIMSQFVKAVRYQGSLNNSLDAGVVSDSFSDILAKNFTSGDLSIISVYFKTIEQCNVSLWCGEFTFFQKILSKLYFWSFEGKTVEYNLYDYLVESGVGGSLHPTSYGYAYADAAGWLGFIYFVILFFSRFLIHNILLTSKYSYLYFGFIFYFILFFSRGSVYNGFIFLILVVGLDVVLNRYKAIITGKL
ncbi:MAG: O-antigen polymerase [Acinetobacter sp.]|uniref:O-antigen polymerase n=1 Tax=Acinetobacter sp. TaxID=472 RepID=UPI0026DB4954|nr:O-antigen polymerase [Acinetobacter sp.]MDO4580633.1 O-antigen polymerase [Acinetobacter sp.]